VEETLRDQGCLRMEILQPATEAGHVVLHALWAPAEAWSEPHRQRPGPDDGPKASDWVLSGTRVRRSILEEVPKEGGQDG
jgi:quinol monooxygenase YgiN